MRLWDQLRGYRIEMASPLSRAAVEQRVEAAAVSTVTPFKTGVAGWARRGRLHLRVRPGIFDYRAGPILTGRIRDEAGGARLRLRYRLPFLILTFAAVWYLLVGLVPPVMVATGEWPIRGAELAGAGLLWLFFLLAPILIHIVATRRTDAYLDALVGFLEDVAEAQAAGGGARRAQH